MGSWQCLFLLRDGPPEMDTELQRNVRRAKKAAAIVLFAATAWRQDGVNGHGTSKGRDPTASKRPVRDSTPKTQQTFVHHV